MAHIALKIDVDTYRGTREGAMRLADLLERLYIRATFLFSLGPDHTGRAIKRVFRRGFMGKVKRTSVLEHYGLKTLLYGVLLPGPHIGKGCREAMRSIGRRNFEAGVHTYDHVKWQDNVVGASRAWTLRELQLARDQFTEIFDRAPEVHGAAGWQLNRDVPELERALGFRYASDVRGTAPFMPMQGGIPQLPTTLPTLDELIGRQDLQGGDPVDCLLRLTQGSGDQVFTLHAELEGGAYLSAFERLLKGWRTQGHLVGDMAEQAACLNLTSLPRCEIVMKELPGRAGLLACQA